MLNISTEPTRPNAEAETAPPKKASLKRYVLEKLQAWVNSLLEAERDEFLGRGRHQPLDERHDNYRNGYRPRKVNLFGLGKVELRVPRDRKGEFESQWLPEGKGQDAELEAFLAEAFLAGLSTRDLARISEKHLGQKFDSKQVSRIVARASTELEAWRQRSLKGQRYKFLYLDGANFRVRINGHVGVQSFCAVLGVEAHSYQVPAQWRFQDEGYSGATLWRPGLEAVRDLAAAGQLQALLVYSPDRLSRKYAYQVLLAEELSRGGVELVFLQAPSGTTPEDQLLVQFQGMIAERAQIAERSRRGKRHRARQGSINVLSGAPYGYR